MQIPVNKKKEEPICSGFRREPQVRGRGATRKRDDKGTGQNRAMLRRHQCTVKRRTIRSRKETPNKGELTLRYNCFKTKTQVKVQLCCSLQTSKAALPVSRAPGPKSCENYRRKD